MKLSHIVITGEAGHGKDTVGAHLIAAYGYARTAFADPLKQEVADAFATGPLAPGLELMHSHARKEEPVPGLALKCCNDESFVATCLKAYAREDKDLFDLLKLTNSHPATNDEQRDAYARQILGAGASDKLIKDLKAAFGALEVLMQSNGGMVAGLPLEQTIAAGGFDAEERMSLYRSARRSCQVWGTEFRREQSDTYWVDRAADFIAASDKPVVICDGRFQNECDWAKHTGMQRLHVVRTGHTQVGIKHASEQIPPPDEQTIVLMNDRRDDNFASLYEQVDAALAHFAAIKPKNENATRSPKI